MDILEDKEVLGSFGKARLSEAGKERRIMSEKIVTVTAENFETEIGKADKPVMLDFWTPWCSYCRRIEPAVASLSEDTEGTLVVGKVNVDEQPALADKFGVETIPSLILFKNGERTGQELIAPGSRDAIEDWLEENGVNL